MGNGNNSNKNQITINNRYSKLENLIEQFKTCNEKIKNNKFNSFNDLEKCENNKNIINIQEKLNDEIKNLRTIISNESSNISEYTKSSMKIKKYIFTIQLIYKDYFEIIKMKTKNF